MHLGNVGFIDPLTALTVGTGLFSLGTGIYGKSVAKDKQAQIIKDQRAAQIRQQTLQKQALATAQNQQARARLLAMSRERRGEQTTLLTAIGIGAAVVSGILIYQALKKKSSKPSSALARR